MSGDPLEYLFSLEQFGIKLGLDNIAAIVAALGHPETSFASVHVAGTNGKGSVTAMVDAAARAARFRTGRFTSPHLVSLTERFAVDGRAVSEEALRAAVATVRDVVQGLRESGRLDVHPTFFEVTTATAFELFRRTSVQLAVCEVGLGGRLDATNVLTPVVTAITSIALDHEQYLGATTSEIAGEKAGIIKAATPMVVGEVDPHAFEAIARIASDRRAPIVRAEAGVEVTVLSAPADIPQRLHLRTPAHDYGTVDLALGGRHQVGNAVIAVRILEALQHAGWTIPPSAIAAGLATVQWPGRLERIRRPDGREALLDAAHNPAGAATLASFLAAQGERQPLVFAAMRDKDVAGIVRALAPHVSAVVATRATHPRSTEPAALQRIVRTVAPDLPTLVADEPEGALTAAWALDKRIVVAGSIFLLGDVRQALVGS